MKNYKKGLISFFTLSLSISLFLSCSRDTDELEEATFPNTPEVFIDGFSAGMEYEAFGESKLTAFNTDNEIKYKGETSMRFDVPNADDPAGGFAAGLFKIGNSRDVEVLNARDLSGYNVLTFWGRASESADVDELGFGFTFDDEKYKAYIANTKFSTTWTKYYVPIPDPTKLTQEQGLFYFVDSPDDGKGYSFWVDEVKFENLGTLAYAKASIQNGQDREETAANGSKFTIGGLSMSANLPNGVDQEVVPAPAYFAFTQSDNSVATLNELGVVEVTGEGTTIITGSVGDISASGSLKIISTGAFIHAPTPTVDPANVISLFSNAYTNVPVEYYNGFWAPFQTTLSADFTINGDDVLSYTDFNFVGTQFTAPTIDATNMTHLHLDLWIPNAVDPAAQFLVRIVDLGPDGSFDDPNPSTSVTYVSPNNLVSQQWISLDISLAGLASKDKLAQVVYENLGTPLNNFYVDNLYFYNDGNAGGGGDVPTQAAPTPTTDAANVISVYSDAYEDIAGTNLNPDWGQSTIVSGEMIDGNNTLLYTGLNFQGIELGSSQDVSGMTHLHVDYWTTNSSALKAFLISPGSETGIDLPVPTSDWGSIDIPLSDFTAVNLMDVIQMKFDGNGNIFLDNIYFYSEGNTGGETMPTMAAPIPTADAADVISVYSDSYTNIDGTNLNPGWGQATVVTGEMIDGNNTLLLTGLDFQGIQLGSAQNVSGMDFLHIDFWSANSSALRAFLISSGPNETGVALTVPTNGWGSIDIPLSDFTMVNLMDVIQMKFDGNGDIYLDNIYFYSDGNTGGETMPSMAAPAPTADAADVISVYSDSYTNVDGTNLNPGWGQATVLTGEMIDGNNTLLLTGLDFQGIQLGSAQNVSEMDFLHIDFWSANSSALRAFLISSGPSETGVALTVPTNGWGSIDIPLSDFTMVNLMDVIQMKFDGNGDIYLDNIYFYKDSGMAAEPTLPITFEDGANPFDAFDNGATAANVDNPDMNGNTSAKVLEFKKVVGSAWYSGIVFKEDLRTTPLIDLANGTTMSIKIWSPKAGITVRFQLEGGAAPAYEVFQVLDAANQWVTLTFDFASQVNPTDTYPRFAIFPDFDTSNQNPVATEAIYYIDDITQQ